MLGTQQVVVTLDVQQVVVRDPNVAFRDRVAGYVINGRFFGAKDELASVLPALCPNDALDPSRYPITPTTQRTTAHGD